MYFSLICVELSLPMLRIWLEITLARQTRILATVSFLRENNFGSRSVLTASRSKQAFSLKMFSHSMTNLNVANTFKRRL